jgi:peptidyl-prolyl cis-trans isomerase A (cyclophilin A)
MITFKTTHGDIKIELFEDEAPISCKNFAQYVKDGFYDNTIFHRIIPGFVLQGGGISMEMEEKDTRDPIKNEAENGLKNSRGSLSMARTPEIDSATSQFFINLVDNKFLDHGERDFGYAVFAKVTEGMDAVDKMAAVQTDMNDFPEEPVGIISATIEEQE